MGHDNTDPTDILDTSVASFNGDIYSVSENSGDTIFEGWVSPRNGSNDSSNFPIIRIKTDEIGQQKMTIRLTAPGNDSTYTDTILTINCGSKELVTVIEAIGGELSEEYKLNTDNVYTSENFDNLTADQYQAILDAKTSYDGLNDAEKGIVNPIIAGITEENIFQVAEAYLFIDSTNLLNVTINEDIETLLQAKSILENALTLGDEFEALSDGVKEIVLEKLSNESIEFTEWSEVEAECSRYLEIINNKLDSLKKDKYKILDGDNQTYTLGSNKDLVIRTNGDLDKLQGIEIDNGNPIDPKYYELESGSTILTLKSSFLEASSEGEHTITFKYDDGEVETKLTIAKAQNDSSNVEEEASVEAEEENEVKEEAKVEAEEVAKVEETTVETNNPKTGDIVLVVIATFVVSVVGLAVTFIKRKIK